MSVSLATKYRPTTFSEICGQKSIVKILTRQLELDDVKHSYLFCGASGCGKTTSARAFANAINKGVGSPIEIDGASNNGVDNVKQIIKSASERSIDSKYKIYIIDEAHMLTTQSWNALLKTIEEPPTYTIFIFCTTDPQKIPQTILNRCMRFNFSRIPCDVIRDRLLYICRNENYSNYEDACDYISRCSNNQMRDAIATLEKCASYDSDLNINNVLQALGNYSYDVFFDLLNALIDGKVEDVLKITNYIYNQGNDTKLFVDQFISFCLDVSKYCIFSTYEVTKLPSSYSDKLNSSVNFDNASDYYSYLNSKLLEIKNMIKTDVDAKTTVDIKLIQIARYQ